jgi:hypothetical protein
MGRATDRLTQHNAVSINFPATAFFGQSLILTRAKFATAGKNRTGSGRTNLEIAVSVTARFAASCDLPNVFSPFSS